MNDKLKDAINSSLRYLSDYANEYLEPEDIERIKHNAMSEGEDPDLWIGQRVYELIQDMDSSAEQEYGFISGVQYAIKTLNNN